MGEREEGGRLFRDRERVRVRRSSSALRLHRATADVDELEPPRCRPRPPPALPSWRPRPDPSSAQDMSLHPTHALRAQCGTAELPPSSRAPAPTCARILARASNASSHHHPTHAPSSVRTLQATHHVLVSPRGNRPRAQRPRTAPHFIPADRAAGRQRERDVRKRNEPPGPASSASGIAASSSVGGARARARLTDRPAAPPFAE